MVLLLHEADGDLRSLLIRAAREILAEPDTPFDLRKVAERAGKSRSAPYVAFGKTEEGGGLAALRLAVAAEGLGELATAMERALFGHSGDAEAGLHALASAYLAWAMEHPRLFRVAFGSEVAHDLRRHSPSPEADAERRGVREARARLERILHQALEAQAEDSLRAPSGRDRTLVAGALWAILHGVAVLTLDRQWELTRLSASEDPRELAKAALRFLTHASRDALRDVARALRKAKAAKDEGVREVEEEEGLLAREPVDPGLGLLDSSEPPVDFSSIPYLQDRDTGLEDGEPGMVVREAMEPPRSVPREPALESSPALRRARTQMALFERARILWVDDQPHRIRHEREMLEGLGAEVIVARSTGEAAEILDRDKHVDLILSDMERGGDPRAGLRGLEPLRTLGGEIPLVFYVERLEPGRPVPSGAFGITNDPEELLHLVLDGLGRGKR